MRNIIYLLIIGFFLICCTKEEQEEKPPQLQTEIKNTAPTTPSLILPENNKLCLSNTLSFEWNASKDTENDAITYEIQVSKNTGFNTFEIITGKISALNYTTTLQKGTTYYWRIKATDSKGSSSNYSETYKFYTSGEAIVNHLPFVPEIVKPKMNSNVSTLNLTLEWNASDVDTNDVLTYDVYCDTNNPPTTLISSNRSQKTAQVYIFYSGLYYWRVVVKDGKGGETVGQVWNFRY